MERLRVIAEKQLGYNRDIDQHIISCRIALELIKQKDSYIDENRGENNRLRSEMNNLIGRLRVKEEEIRQKDQEIKQYKQIIEECYDQIEYITQNKRQRKE